MKSSEVLKLVEGVQGWLLDEAALRLYDLARCAPTFDAIEVGSWRGKSTIAIAAGLRQRAGGGKLYAVDTWLGTASESIHKEIIAELPDADLFADFAANVERAGLADVVVPIRAASAWAVLDPRLPAAVGLVLLDADHELEAVRADYLAWAPRVAPGGYLVLDDVPGWPGPTEVAHTLAASDFDVIAESHNQWIGRRPTTPR